MGTMSAIDHSSPASLSASVDLGSLVSRLDDIIRLADFIAKKDAVVVEAASPKVEVAGAQVTVHPPEQKVSVPITVPVPTVNVANNIDSRWPRILAWLVAGDIIMKVAGLAWQMASTMK